MPSSVSNSVYYFSFDEGKLTIFSVAIYIAYTYDVIRMFSHHITIQLTDNNCVDLIYKLL